MLSTSLNGIIYYIGIIVRTFDYGIFLIVALQVNLMHSRCWPLIIFSVLSSNKVIINIALVLQGTSSP